MREERARTREIDLRAWAPEAVGSQLLEELDALALGECARVRLPVAPNLHVPCLTELGFETMAARGPTEAADTGEVTGSGEVTESGEAADTGEVVDLLVWRCCDALAGLIARHHVAST